MGDDEVKRWKEKIATMEGKGSDLSRDEDLSIALMNLVSLEEHFFFTAMKTGDGKYLDFLHDVREKRKEFLKEIVTDPVGEEWCISKHLLAASMRFYEVGCKEQSTKGKKEAERFFNAGFDLWSLFFSINLKLIESKKLESEVVEKEKGKMGKLSSLMKSVIDCCKEW